MRRCARGALALLLCGGLLPAQTPFERAIQGAESALASGQLDEGSAWIQRALERDPKSREAWALRARLAAARQDVDDQVYALHQQHRLARLQRAPKAEVQELRTRLEQLDSIAPDLLDMSLSFVDKLSRVAEDYEKQDRPHSAIRVHQQILALQPDLQSSVVAIERLSARPDPSLADTAKAQDLLADVSEEWIREHDEKHNTWKGRAKLERENYVTYTDAGYEVLIRAAEAMEQMNAFYRQFFRYGTPGEGGSVSRINLHIFQTRDEYLKLGIGPPVEWSGGHFTGGAVETYMGEGGIEGMVTTLFHEAAHQFVSLATSAVGWLNEGLASFFEGCRILPNGTVLMNFPAMQRLMPLASRMERGWMEGHDDGLDAADPNVTPGKAPRFRTVLENRYAWGPPWYAPTWGVVYFLYNYQDPVDGRFVYRNAFQEFINASAGKSGDTAVETFEKVVLAQPQAPTKGVDFSQSPFRIELPRTVQELDEVWKDYILRLREQQTGRLEQKPPYLEWARYALERREYEIASEHFEKGLVEDPGNMDLLVEFADLLATRFKNTDRASRLIGLALRELEWADEADVDQIRSIEKLASKWDPRYSQMNRLRDQLRAAFEGLAQRYLAAGLPRMAMDVSWRFGNDLNLPEIFAYYEQALRKAGSTTRLWSLVYNEADLEGWTESGRGTFLPDGSELAATLDSPDEAFAYRFLTLDQVIAGDYSLETEIKAEAEVCQFAGLVFGQKDGKNFHALIYRPGQRGDDRYGKVARLSGVELTSFYANDEYKVWRENKVGEVNDAWHKLRVDVTGRLADIWVDDQWIVTHEFPSRDVLRGRIGLLMGPGNARFRDIRYLARHPRDMGSRIERDLRMERLRESAGPEGPVGDSYVGLVPPWPEVRSWVQGDRTSFDDRGAVPQVLAFFSIPQNDRLPLDGWLRDLATRYEDIGLQVISVAQPDDARALGAYLQQHAFPGTVGADTRQGRGYGNTFEEYFIPKYQLPRVLLLDVDQRVVWEGSSGFEMNAPWQPGMEPAVETPLKELIEKRHLRELAAWLHEWEGSGYQRLRRGDLAGTLPILQQAEELGGAAILPAVEDALLKLGVLRSSIEAISSTAMAMERMGRVEAVHTLLEWGEVLGVEVSSESRRDLKSVLAQPAARAWARVSGEARKIKDRLDSRSGLRAAEGLLKMAQDEPQSEFCRLVASELEAAIASEDLEYIQRVVGEIENTPGRWLIQEYYYW